MTGENLKSGYRPDIDGLRALAVISVLIYHAFPAWLPGGFLGVDVFFVISGFLIGGMLLEEAAQSGRISPVIFYQRRAVRLLPALCAVLAACYAGGSFLFTRQELDALGRQGAAAAGFYSNLQLWRETGYFDRAAQLKPLLHLWSLGIEEQFYLVFPLALILLFRLGARVGLPVAALTLASFAACLLQRSNAAAFYAPYARFWEIGSGILVAIADRKKLFFATPVPSSLRLPISERRAASWLGIGLIAYACFFFDAEPVAGGAKLAENALPVLGACLLIAAGLGEPAPLRVLTHPASVFIGRISYPLYLWHWPLLSFAFITRGRDLPASVLILLLVAAFLLAAITYRWIETPVRFGKARSRNALASLAALIFLGCAGEGLSLINPRRLARNVNLRANEGDLAWDDPDPACASAVGLDRIAGPEEAPFCSMSGTDKEIKALILGDSSANSLYPGMAGRFGRGGMRVAMIGMGSCAPIRGLEGHFTSNRSCKAVNDASYRFALGHPAVETVILGFTPWDFQHMTFAGFDSRGSKRALFYETSRRLIQDAFALRTAGKRVVLVFDAPRIGYLFDECRHARGMEGPDSPPARAACSVAAARMLQQEQPYLDWWRQAVAKQPGLCVFNQLDALSDSSGNVAIADQAGFIFRDDHHLTKRGSAAVADGFARSACAPPGLR